MMAMGLYMAINNKNNTQLVILEKFVKNELMEEFTIPPTAQNPFARLDGIIRSQVAMEDEYKTRIPIQVGIVRQYHLLFEQLATRDFPANDRWVEFYLPVYRQLRQHNLHDAFVYHILNSTSIKQVPEWSKSNEKVLARFYDVTNSSMKVWRQQKPIPELGYSDPVTCWYGDDLKLEAIGNKKSEEVRVGPWYFFFDNGVTEAKGAYDDQGNKIGRWLYYNDSGYLTKMEDFNSGLNERYTQEGKPWQKYYLKDGEVDGEVLVYFGCGAVRERLFYKAGMRHGPGQVFNSDGKVIEKFIYQDDSLQGHYESFYHTGEPQTKTAYVRGEMDGAYQRFHQNGKVDAEGAYQAGRATGPWKFYHSNGKLREEGKFVDDKPFGEFRYYNRAGKLTEVKNFNSLGVAHGENLLFHDGALHNKITYESGRIVKTTYFDKRGAEMATYAEQNGKLTARAHFPTGEIRSEFAFQEGRATGTWKYYGRSGNLESEHEYADDERHGKTTEYFASGAKKYVLFYEHGEMHGPYLSYYTNGKLNNSGWYQHDHYQQRWLTFHPNGNIQADEYYLNGEQAGASYYYDGVGKLLSSDEMKGSEIRDVANYNVQGERVSKGRLTNGSGEFLTTFVSGKPFQQLAISCGQFAGPQQIFLPDGTAYQSKHYLQGKLHGPIVYRGPFGEPLLYGHYSNGNAAGTWTWYYPGGEKEVIGKFYEDERDSVWTYYFRNGKIAKTVPYQDGERHGVSEVFGPDGTLILRKQFADGDLVAYQLPGGTAPAWIRFSGHGRIEATYPDGRPALEEFYKNGQVHGEVKLYHRNGKPYSIQHFYFGDYEGDQTIYFPDGSVQNKSQYQLDSEQGTVTWYDPTGKPERVEQFENGKLNGTSTRFQQGKKVFENRFRYGMPVD
jgi:antitoxin component YwqK of YwqJK toxin-antitoxin module